MQFFLRRNGPSFLHKEFTLKSFNSPKAYHTFVKEGAGQKENLPRPVGGCFLGSESFIQSFTKQLEQHKNKDVSGKKDLFRFKNKDPNFQIYCFWKYGRLTQQRIGEMFSVLRDDLLRVYS